MTKVKLYTEDQVKKAIESARENSFGSDFQRWLTKSEESIMKGLTSIELPSEREIEDNAKHYGSLIGNKNGTAVFDYFKGAKFVIDKIQGGNK